MDKKFSMQIDEGVIWKYKKRKIRNPVKRQATNLDTSQQKISKSSITRHTCSTGKRKLKSP